MKYDIICIGREIPDEALQEALDQARDKEKERNKNGFFLKDIHTSTTQCGNDFVVTITMIFYRP